ncbi:MAG: hypothetical protein S4CHLAM102_13120 [Chlamydiia bacterium]|nr:hypothetical protein [Chlamydiia bacterium]
MKQIALPMILTIAATLAPCSKLSANPNASPMHQMPLMEPQNLMMHNRPLVKVLDRTISVRDVVKQMDIFLKMHHPEAFESKAKLYQFYSSQWKNTLDSMINAELICAMAEKEKIKISDGDVREEMTNQFGPNLMSAIDELGITYNEAKEYIHTQLVERQMMWMHVYQRVFQIVTPEKTKGAYLQHLAENPPKEEWVYRMMTVKNADSSIEDHIAHVAVSLMSSQSEGLESLSAFLQKEHPDYRISISDDMILEKRHASPEMLAILNTLAPNELSTPVKQFSRREKSDVYRVFELKSHEQAMPPAFFDIAQALKDQLINSTADELRDQYISKVRKHFRCEDPTLYEMIPSDFAPFSVS